MKASLVSATSLMALLAFEVGIDAGIDVPPANAQVFSATPSPLSFGYVLLNGTTAASAVVDSLTVHNTAGGGATVTIGGITASPFSGAGVSTVFAASGTGATATRLYTFAPTVTGSFSNSITITGGASGGNHQSLTIAMNGTAVAPVQSVTLVNSAVNNTGTATYVATTTISGTTVAKTITGASGNQIGTTVRVGTTATIAAITVANIGDADKIPGYATMSLAQLTGNIGALSGSVFTGAGGSISLHDSFNTATLATVTGFTYAFAPTVQGSAGATATINFSDGSSAGTNASQVASVTLAATGVGPVFGSNISVATPVAYSNSTAIGHVSVTAGTLAVATGHNNTSSITVTISNSSTGPSGSLTDLTLEDMTLTGTNASDFSIAGFTPDTVVAAGGLTTVTLDFTGPTVGSYTAELAIDTDQGASLFNGGTTGQGAIFVYQLTWDVPEPATIVTFGMGLAGLAFARRRRRSRL